MVVASPSFPIPLSDERTNTAFLTPTIPFLPFFCLLNSLL